jgi:hypothetical protein
MRVTAGTILSAIVIQCLPALLAAQVESAAPGPAGLAGDTARPYHQLVRTALEQYHPRVLDEGVSGGVAYVYFLSDGAGRITRTALDSVPPHGSTLRDAFLERWRDVDTDALARAARDAMYPNATNSWHRKGEFGPDSVVVFWTEPAVDFGREAAAAGPYRLGRAVTRQTTPREIRVTALRAAPGEVVWYLYDDDRPVMETGTYPGGKDALEGIRSMLSPRYPGAVLTCALGTAVFNRHGEPVRVYSVRMEPRGPGS